MFGRVGTIGVPSVLEHDIKFGLFVSTGSLRMNLNYIFNYYIKLFIQSSLFFKQVEDNVGGVAQKNLNTGWLSKFLTPLPPLKEQHVIVKKTNKLFNVLDRLEKEKSDYDKNIIILSNKILDLAVRGKLVKQCEEDESIEKLIGKIKAEKEKLIKEKKIKKEKWSEIYQDSTDKQFYEKFENGETKIITDEIPFEIPNSWKWVRLRNITKLITDGTHKTPNYVENGIPFLSVQNISSGKFDFTKIKYVSKEEHLKLSKRVSPQKNDILFCRIGTLGKALKIDIDLIFDIFVSLGLIRLIDVNLTDYIVFLINSSFGKKWIDDNKVGGGTHTNKINLNSLPGFLIPLPSQKEQKRITKKIEQILNAT